MHRRVRLGVAIGASVVLTACGAGDEIHISGAVTRGFDPGPQTTVADFGDTQAIEISDEAGGCGIELMFPRGLAPGAYAMDDRAHEPGASRIWGQYAGSCVDPDGPYVSTGGRLTLTTIISDWTGTFEFNAVAAHDPSKVINVVGRFHGPYHP
jgi:hypothetical protein